ncbi:hypothetical protein [Catenuloplanes indicus]|uniref:Integral membrane protein n=1 Tax=Catenuloplanes indicus TaxID=137267 RepID=A0AAE4AX86_9ACTN|nr:hypothetical protein [Catenuloplanes indicus]MDQ0365912.1 hypothetical protein [Catenuloplanes indicus]
MRATGRSLTLGGAALGATTAMLWVATPASAFAHDKVTNPYLHALLDVLSLAVVISPVVSAYLWGARRRGLLMALAGLVQIPVAVIAFLPIVPPAVHLLLFGVAVGLTIGSIRFVRGSVPSPAAATEPSRG